jgi:dipeptidyl aminopeptidase/acylaminoacyl peptidase
MEMDRKSHLTPEKVDYASGEVNLPALLFVHDRSHPQPGVVVCPGRVGTADDLAWLCEPLAKAGFVTLAIQYRPIPTQYYLTDVEDIQSALQYLENRDFVAASQLGVVGHSRGGLAALNSARQQSRIRTLVAISPVTDHAHLVRGLRQFAPSRYELMVAARGGTPEEIPKYYREISPLHHADQIHVPVLLIHGTNDLITPHEHSLWMLEALQKVGNQKSSLQLIQGAGHFFEQTYSGYAFDKVAELTVSWLRENLK